MITLTIIAGLILLNGLFVAAEFAIIGAPRPAIDARAAEGHRLARSVQAVLRDPRRQDRYIATAQLGITAASLGLGMYGEHAVAEWLQHALTAAGAPEWIGPGVIASVVAVGVLTYFHIVFGEMVPKSLALQYAGRMALWITPPMLWIKYILYPVVVGLNGLGNLVLKAMGVNRFRQAVDHYYTPEELQLIVRESEESGALLGESGRMLQEIFEFGDLTAGQVMVPRVRVTGIPLGTTPAELRDLLGRAPHTRYPVFEGDLDNIVGVLHIKDALRVLLTRERVVPTHARAVPVVPETAPLDAVLATMRRERTQMAIVIDEHGGTAGVVTIEDLFEEVVGAIEAGQAEPPMAWEQAGRLRVKGTVRLDEVGEQFDLDVEHEDVDSVSGLVLTLLGRLPSVGDVVVYGQLQFEVTAVKGHGVEECVVRRRG